MLKFDHFNVGDYVRAYDHQPVPGREELFVEGIIVEKVDVRDRDYVAKYGDERDYFSHYVVHVYEDSVCKDKRDYVYVPFGTSFDYDGRVSIREIA